MDISKIDYHLASSPINGEEFEWLNARDEQFSLHGVFYDEKNGRYTRLPEELVEQVPRLTYLSRMTAGGRLRFVTDSKIIAIKASIPAYSPMPHMSITGSHGFSVYADNFFRARYSPVFKDFLTAHDNEDENVYFAEKKTIAETNEKRLIEIYFPLYGGLNELFIGIEPGSVIEVAPGYSNPKPMVFYGSSITQGACVTRPGLDYISTLARKLNMDFINLGFSGSGNCEEPMLEYINSIDACLYAYDYNMWKNQPDRVLPPHFSIYERFRKTHPNAGILLYDKPGCDLEPYPEREEIIRATYEKTLELGDDRVGYIPTKAFLGEGDRDSCMVDPSHPGDLGAYRMAEALIPVIKKIIK